jgi:uncharacterized protein
MSETKTPVANSPAEPWWTVPAVWLVIGGPFVVVIAAIVTGLIAWNGAEPVVGRGYEDSPRVKQVADPASAAKDPLAPAMQARNHVMTPTRSPD